MKFEGEKVVKTKKKKLKKPPANLIDFIALL